MTSVSKIDYNLDMANYIYGVDPNAQHGEDLAAMGTNILIFGPLAGVGPTCTKYWSKTKSTWAKKRADKISWSDASKLVSEERAKQAKELEYLSKNASGEKYKFIERRTNISDYNKLTAAEGKLPQLPKLANNATPTPQYTQQLQKLSCYDEAKKLIEEAKSQKLTGKRLKVKLRQIENAIQKGDIKLHELQTNGTIKPLTKCGKFAAKAKKYTGYNATKGFILKSKNATKALKGLKAGCKGGGVMALVALGFELPAIVEAFNVKKEVGWKQVKKSTVKAAASMGGYIAGSAALGAAVGSVVPVAGTAVGAIVGVIGGVIGGFLAGKVADKIVGEETAVEEYARTEGIKATSSKKEHDKLLTQASQKACEEGDEEMLTQLGQYEQAIYQVEEENNLAQATETSTETTTNTTKTPVYNHEYDELQANLRVLMLMG
jgi:hypothetical protein